jgi:hypothetical protein
MFYPKRMGGGVMPGMPVAQPAAMPAKPQYSPTPYQATGPIKNPWEMALLAAGANLVAGKGFGGGILGGLEGYLNERSYQDQQKRQAETQQYERHRDEVTDYKDDRDYKTDEFRDTRDYAAGRDDEGYRRKSDERDFGENRRQFGLNYGLDRDRFAENQRQFGLNYGLDQNRFQRGIYESDRGYDRGVLESDRDARRAQSNDDWQRSQDIVEGNYKAGQAARDSRKTDAEIDESRARAGYYRAGGGRSGGTPLDVDANDVTYFEDDAARMLGVETLDDAGVAPEARMRGAQAYSQRYQETRNHADAVEAGMAAMNAPVGSTVGTLPGTGIFGTDFMGQTGILPPSGAPAPQQAPGTAEAAQTEGGVEARKTIGGKNYVKIGGQWFEE